VYKNHLTQRETTEWDDIQRRLGNLPPLPDVPEAPPMEASRDGECHATTAIRLVRGIRASKPRNAGRLHPPATRRTLDFLQPSSSSGLAHAPWVGKGFGWQRSGSLVATALCSPAFFFRHVGDTLDAHVRLFVCPYALACTVPPPKGSSARRTRSVGPVAFRVLLA